MRAHYFQHDPAEGLGSIETWLQHQGAEISVTRWYEPDTAMPVLDGIDLLIIMGGPMSVNDEEQLPWLVSEKALVRQAVSQGSAILGICLGAQMIASALGARIYPNHCREIGWFPVTSVAPAATDAFPFPAEAMVLHWHGETFDLPSGAIQLARSAGCEHQAFQLGERVIGLQFHPEATPEVINGFLAGAGDLPVEPYVATAPQIAATPASYFSGSAVLLDQLLTYLTSGTARPSSST